MEPPFGLHWAWFCPKVGVASKISRATVLLEPPFRKSWIHHWREREREREREKGCRSGYNKEREKHVSIVKGRERRNDQYIAIFQLLSPSISPVSYKKLNNKLV